MTRRPDPPPMLKAVAPVWIGGVRAIAELLLGPADEGRAVVGLLGLSACPGVSLLRVVLSGDRLECCDVVDPEVDRQLARIFGLPAAAVRDVCCELAADMIADMVVDPPTSTRVH